MQSTFDYHKFKVFCYATTEGDGSEYRARVEEAHRFVLVSDWSTKDIVERIVKDGIHIRKICSDSAFPYTTHRL